MQLSLKQLKLLGVARKRLKLSEEVYRDILHVVAGVESVRDIDWTGFSKVMERFKELGFESTWSARNFGGHRGGMATPLQLDMVRRMWEAHIGEPGEAGLNAWLQRTAKVSALRFLDAEGAHAAINGLRAMTRRKKKATDAA